MPRRILRVTGRLGGTASRTRETISSAVSGVLRRKPPRQRPRTFLTGHPKLMSIQSKPASTSRRAAGAKSSGFAPMSCPPTGCSSSAIASRARFLLLVPTFARNWSSITSHSVYDAPKRRAITLIGRSLYPESAAWTICESRDNEPSVSFCWPGRFSGRLKTISLNTISFISEQGIGRTSFVPVHVSKYCWQLVPSLLGDSWGWEAWCRCSRLVRTDQ